ncbi:hypothetical protein EH165_10005 [Nakamurella antarctica]|uniref:Uncharacterized protein n=1 Tax=Nakamurella antarctica TaxID=1902245 RepID=A0A3G8ZXQ1_9ACTN|nr:hypothetical protein [Nakamurella antarctica]AZI58421.1 hypothetical protein EH165_10005 [Nakamurella antarctica]
MSWQWLIDGIDAVESWLVLLPLLVQIPLLLVVLLPLAWGTSWVIDRVVEFALRRHTARSEKELADAEVARAERTM